MILKFSIIVAYCCLLFELIFCKPKTIKENEDLWLKNLINFILDETKPHKTIIIRDKQQNVDTVAAKINHIISELSRKMPVVLFDMEEIIHSRLPDTFECDMFHFYKEQLFFMYIRTFEKSLPNHSKNATDMLRWISCNTMDPKIIVVQFSERDYDFEEDLRYAWQKQLLDYTILLVVKNQKRSFFLPEYLNWNSNFLHRLNPFTDVYTREEYKPGTEFFPNKLKDMNGYNFNTSMIHLPPGSVLKKNESGHVIDVYGTDGMTLKAFEKTLNFTANLITPKIDTFGTIFPNGSGTLVFKDIQDGFIELICSGAYVFGSPMQLRVERSQFIGVEQCCTLVPITMQTKILMTAETYLALLVTGAVVLVVWITTILMKFDPELMDPLKLICMLMTVPLSREPEHSQLVERIIFGACLIVSLAYSSTIFAQLTEILMKTDTEVPFNSFDDLDKSGLRLLMHPNLITHTFVDDEQDDALSSLRNKTQAFLLSNECPKVLLKYKNVSCVGTETWTNMIVQMTKKHNDYTMKLAKPCFWSATRAYILRKGSPYVSKINKIISRSMQGGLLIKWNDDYTREAMFEAKRNEGFSEDVEDKSSLAGQLWNVFIFGSLVSFVIFIGEYIVFKIQNKRNRIVIEK